MGSIHFFVTLPKIPTQWKQSQVPITF